MNAKERGDIARVHERLDDIIARGAKRDVLLAQIAERIEAIKVEQSVQRQWQENQNGDIKTLQKRQNLIVGGVRVVVFLSGSGLLVTILALVFG